ncbi:MAG: hypothetical protein U9N50_06895 [Pseudomonadota bacterium]|nr:hypothetical protein [Pseudomonadota bacterium]
MTGRLPLIAEVNHAADVLGICRAEQFTFLYALLEKYFSADSAAMAHWLRRKNASLCTTPLLAMVDQGRMEVVIAATLRKG